LCWQPIEAFESLHHYQHFLSNLDNAVADGKAKVVPIDEGRGWGSAWRERWYECKEDGRVWRLVPPNGPFPGVFHLV